MTTTQQDLLDPRSALYKALYAQYVEAIVEHQLVDEQMYEKLLQEKREEKADELALEHRHERAELRQRMDAEEYRAQRLRLTEMAIRQTMTPSTANDLQERARAALRLVLKSTYGRLEKLDLELKKLDEKSYELKAQLKKQRAQDAERVVIALGLDPLNGEGMALKTTLEQKGAPLTSFLESRNKFALTPERAPAHIVAFNQIVGGRLAHSGSASQQDHLEAHLDALDQCKIIPRARLLSSIAASAINLAPGTTVRERTNVYNNVARLSHSSETLAIDRELADRMLNEIFLRKCKNELEEKLKQLCEATSSEFSSEFDSFASTTHRRALR